MKVPRRSNARRLGGLFLVAMMLAGSWVSPGAIAQKEKVVEGFPAVLQRDITLWSDGTRLSGVLLYPKDRGEDEKLPAIVLCNGWGGTKAFLMQSGIAPRFAAAGYVIINGIPCAERKNALRCVSWRMPGRGDEVGNLLVR